jgi:ABC-type antimicrobial peptide transport system permease subunit
VKDYLMVIPPAALVAAALLGGAIGVAANVLHRSTQRAKDVATLRILGARRPHIFRMFLTENVAGVVLGVLLASLILTVVFALWRSQDLVAVLGAQC